jgi:hypothetical protein
VDDVTLEPPPDPVVAPVEDPVAEPEGCAAPLSSALQADSQTIPQAHRRKRNAIRMGPRLERVVSNTSQCLEVARAMAKSTESRIRAM